MSGKKRAEKDLGTSVPTVAGGIAQAPRGDRGQKHKMTTDEWKLGKSSGRNENPSEDIHRCSVTGKLTPYIPIPKPFPIPWLPIFIPPLDAPDTTTTGHYGRRGFIGAAPNRRNPSTALLSLLGQTRYFVPQLDEQMIGPMAARQCLAEWELVLRASGIGAVLPRPLPVMSQKMRGAFLYCDCCELTWLVGKEAHAGSGGSRVQHPWHDAYGGADRLKKKGRSRQAQKPLGSIVVHIAAGFPPRPPKATRSSTTGDVEARIAISFGPGSRYNLVRSLNVLNVGRSKEIAELLAASHALELIATEVFPDHKVAIHEHRAEKRAAIMKKRDVDNERECAEKRRDEAMQKIRNTVFKTMHRIRMTDVQMFGVERMQFDELIREMLFPQNLGVDRGTWRPITQENIEKALTSIERCQELTKPLFSTSDWGTILEHFMPRFEVLTKRLDTYHDGLITAAVEQMRKMACNILLRNGLKLAQIDAWCVSRGGGLGMKLRDLAALCWNFKDEKTGDGSTAKARRVREDFYRDEAIVVTMLMCAVRESLGPMAWELHGNYDIVRGFMKKAGDDPGNGQRLSTYFMRDRWLSRIKRDDKVKEEDDRSGDDSPGIRTDLTASNDKKFAETATRGHMAPSVGQALMMTKLQDGVAALGRSSSPSPPLPQDQVQDQDQDQDKDTKSMGPTSPCAEDDHNVVMGEEEQGRKGSRSKSDRAQPKKPPPRVPAVRVIMITDSQEMVDSICKHQEDWTIHFERRSGESKELTSIPQVKNTHGEVVGNRLEWLRLWASVANLSVLHNTSICWYAVPRTMNMDAVEMLSAASPKRTKE